MPRNRALSPLKIMHPIGQPGAIDRASRAYRRIGIAMFRDHWARENRKYLGLNA